MSPEPLDPNKFHVLDKRKKYILAMFFVLVGFVLLPLTGLGYYKVAVNREAPIEEAKNFQIEQGQGVSEIAQNLYAEKLINSEFLFKFYVYINSLQTNIQAGTYNVQPDTNLIQLVSMLQNGRNDVSITFIEGWRNEQFALEATKKFPNITYADFLDSAYEYQGTLFPDTYVFASDIVAEDLIRVLNQTFINKTSEMLAQDNLRQVELTKEDVINIAAMVEREVIDDNDRKKVAGIIIKRLQQGMQLDIDATTQYIAIKTRAECDLDIAELLCPDYETAKSINWWPSNLTVTELENTNPYNTRAVTGLPPRAIANPGLQSIEAVVNYEESPYFYYLTDSQGTTHYAVTLDDHNINIQRYLR